MESNKILHNLPSLQTQIVKQKIKKRRETKNNDFILTKKNTKHVKCHVRNTVESKKCYSS